MALQGKFVINDADYSPLMFYGVGTFRRFQAVERIAIVEPVPRFRRWDRCLPGNTGLFLAPLAG